MKKFKAKTQKNDDAYRGAKHQSKKKYIFLLDYLVCILILSVSKQCKVGVDSETSRRVVPQPWHVQSVPESLPDQPWEFLLIDRAMIMGHAVCKRNDNLLIRAP